MEAVVSQFDADACSAVREVIWDLGFAENRDPQFVTRSS
jgi:hypothetical protein